MNLISNRIRGMQDILLHEGESWLNVCRIMEKRASLYGFKFSRTPALEYTNLFERSSGDSSDIVNKEMYTFKDKSGRSISLRPEGTAGIMRAVLEEGISNFTLPLKLMYNCSCYRYEKPQSGRYREFFQFGLEIFGCDNVSAEAELIKVAKDILSDLEIKNVILQINSIGCKNCRKNYIDNLKKYFENHKSELCKSCMDKLERNPLRILDCKEKSCIEIVNKAPIITDYLCEKCSQNFAEIQKKLDFNEIKYEVNSKIVRGLDYYTGIVFEFLNNIDGTNLAICGGGRYDDLAETLGGPKIFAAGLGFGIERVMLAIKHNNSDFKGNLPQIYIASTDESSKHFSEKLCNILRKINVYAEYDLLNRSLKSQMKFANKIGAKYVIVLGDDEIKSGKANLRNMETGEETPISILQDFEKEFLNATKN